MENQYIVKSGSASETVEWTQDGDYKIIIEGVGTPVQGFINLCLEGGAIGHCTFNKTRNVHDRQKVAPDGRCVNSIFHNEVSNEYTVKGIKSGYQIKAWPSFGNGMNLNSVNGGECKYGYDGHAYHIQFTIVKL